jgi:hypothetical protein
MPHYEDAIDYSSDEDMHIAGGGGRRCRKDQVRVSFCASNVRRSRAGNGNGKKSPTKRKESASEDDPLALWRLAVAEAAKKLKLKTYSVAPKKTTEHYKVTRKIYNKWKAY